MAPGRCRRRDRAAHAAGHRQGARPRPSRLPGAVEVLEGTATLELDGRTISAGPGETVEVPPGAPHRNPYNATDADLRLRHTASPGGAFAEAFVSSLGHHMENDTVNDQGEFSDLQLFVVLHGTRARSYRARIPVAVQKPVIALGAAVGRRRGLRPGYE